MATRSGKYILLFSLSMIRVVISIPVWLAKGETTLFYIDLEQKYNWIEADKACKLQNYQLATIDSEYITELFYYNLWIGGKSSYSNRGHGVEQDELDPFIWEATKQEFSFTYWAKGHHNNNRSTDYCVYLLQNSYPPFGWKYDSCDNPKFGFICDAPDNSGEEQIWWER